MTNFVVPSSELLPLTAQPVIQSTNNFSNKVFGNPQYIEGTRKINLTCLELNGTSDYVIITEPQFNDPFTFDCWVWLRAISNSEQVILSQVLGSSLGNLSLSIKNQVLTLNNNTQEIPGNVIITPKQWHHIALTRTGLICKVYLDGQLENSYENFVSPPRTQTQIGARLGTNLLNGRIDACRFRKEVSWSSGFTPPSASDYIADPYWDDVSLLLQGQRFTSDRDPYADNVSFQLGMDDYNQSNTLGPWDDSGILGATFVGNAKIASGHFKHTSPSIAFDGIDDSIVITHSDRIVFGNTFTLEFWLFFPDFTAKRTCFDKRESSNTTGFLVYQDTDSKLYVKFGDSSVVWEVELTSGVLTTGWHWFAIVRNASDTNSWKLFVDGTQSGSTVNSNSTIDNTAPWIIGRNRDSQEYFKGHLSELQLTQNTAKYTSSATVPTEPSPDPLNLDYEQTSLLLHFAGTDATYDFVDSSRWNHSSAGVYGVRCSTTQSKFGNSSLYLSGSVGQGLVFAPHESFNLGEDDFTIECWVRLDTIGAARYFLGNWVDQSIYPHPGYLLGITASNRFTFYFMPYSGLAVLTGTTITVAANTWYHVAVTRKKDTYSLWVNGALDNRANIGPVGFRSSVKLQPDLWKQYGFIIGSYAGVNMLYNGNVIAGYIDEVRVIKGRSVYNQPFSVPTSEYTLNTNYPYTNTNLTLFLDVDSNYKIKDKSVGCNLITLEGQMIAGKPIGGSYASFDGTGDAIRFTSKGGDVPTYWDDYTVEAWVYPINGGYVAQNYGRIIETEQYTTSGGFLFNMRNSGTTNPCGILFQDSKTGGAEFSLDSLTTVIANNTWSHVAATKENNILTLYFNGVPVVREVGDVPFTTDRAGSGFTLSNANKTAVCSTAAATRTIATTSYFDSQQDTGVYWEILVSTAGQFLIGVISPNFSNYSANPGSVDGGWSYYSSNGNKYINGTNSAYGASYTSTNVIGCAVRNGKIYWSKNGVWQNSSDPVAETNPAYTNLTGFVSAAVGRYDANSSHTIRTKLDEFTYPIPVGFIPLREACFKYHSLVKSKISIGANNAGSPTESFYGNIDDIRITSGQVRYNVQWIESVLAGDANSANVMLLINGNGNNGESIITDSSTSNKTITVNAVTTTTATKRFGTASMRFNGTSSYLSLADTDDWALGSGDFTIECWYKFYGFPTTAYSSTGGQYLYSQWQDASNYVIIAFGSGGIIFEAKSAGSTVVTLSPSIIHSSHWHHLAITRSGTTITMWLDGVSKGTVTLAGAMPNIAAPLQLGRLSSGANYFNGWMDDFRITKGFCRYPAEFKFPSIPYTGMLPINNKKVKDTPRIADPSMIRTVKGSLAKFDTAIDFSIPSMSYPTTPSTTSSTGQFTVYSHNFSMVSGVSDFTIEGWFYPTVTSEGWVFAKDLNTVDGFLFSVTKDILRFRCPSSTELALSGLTLTGWNHIVFQRRGNLKQIFVNGVKQAEGVQEFNASAYDDTILLGSISTVAANIRYCGLIDQFRYTRGVARYTTNFSSPTEPYPSQYKIPTNTNLQLFFNSPSSLPETVKLVGKPKLIKPSGVSESGACWFDGSYDAIQLSSGSVILSEDFTLEFWTELHQFGAVSKPIVIWSQTASLSQNDKVCIASVGRDLVFFFGTTYTVLDTIDLYTWYHIAMTREQGLVKIYLNGVKKYEQSIPLFGTGTSMIGEQASQTVSASEYRFRGFITNFRILKNKVIYTANFTPSTTLSNQDETNIKPLEDLNNPLILGQLHGTLDEVTIMKDIGSNSMLTKLNDDARQITYSSSPETNEFTNKIFRNPDTCQYWGTGRIWGTVTDAEGTPMSRRIVLMEYFSYVIVEEQWSDPITGYYEFNNLDTNACFVIVAEDIIDYRYNHIIRAYVKAE